MPSIHTRANPIAIGWLALVCHLPVGTDESALVVEELCSVSLPFSFATSAYDIVCGGGERW